MIKTFSFPVEHWESHPNVEIVKWIQARNRTDDEKSSGRVDSSSETEEDDEVETNEEHETSEKDSADGSDEESSEDESQTSAMSNKFGVLSAE